AGTPGTEIAAWGGHAGAPRQVGWLARGLIVEPLEQHGDDATDMRNDIFNVRVALWHAPGDQVQDKGDVLERGADGNREAIVVDHGRADAVLDRVIVEEDATPVHLVV